MKLNLVVPTILAAAGAACVLLAASTSFAQQYPPQQYPPQQYPPQQYPPQQYPPQQGYPPQQYPPQQYPPQQYPPQQYPPQQGYPPQQYPPQQQPPAPPPPPKSSELQWSVRFNPLDLVFGRADGIVEYAPFYPLSIGVGPSYVFGDAMASDNGISAKGAGIFGEVGVWLEGRPLRGWFIKGHFEYESVTLRINDYTGVEYDKVTIPKGLVGALFGSQHLIGSVFTYQWGIGVVYDTQAAEHTLKYKDGPTPAEQGTYTIKKSGILHNGVDLISQLAIGVSF